MISIWNGWIMSNWVICVLCTVLPLRNGKSWERIQRLISLKCLTAVFRICHKTLEQTPSPFAGDDKLNKCQNHHQYSVQDPVTIYVGSLPLWHVTQLAVIFHTGGRAERVKKGNAPHFRVYIIFTSMFTKQTDHQFRKVWEVNKFSEEIEK
jgi:hypothetical protein